MNNNHDPHFMLTRLFLLAVGLSLALSSCATIPKPTDREKEDIIYTAMVAELHGKLVDIDGCIRVKGGEQDDGVALVWPPDLRMTREDGQIRVVSGLVTGKYKEVVLKIGDWVEGGGGNTVSLDEQLRQTIPEHCPGPYWVVAGIWPMATPTP